MHTAGLTLWKARFVKLYFVKHYFVKRKMLDVEMTPISTDIFSRRTVVGIYITCHGIMLLIHVKYIWIKMILELICNTGKPIYFVHIDMYGLQNVSKIYQNLTMFLADWWRSPFWSYYNKTQQGKYRAETCINSLSPSDVYIREKNSHY